VLYGEFGGTTEHIMLYSGCITNRDSYDRVQLYVHFKENYIK